MVKLGDRLLEVCNKQTEAKTYTMDKLCRGLARLTSSRYVNICDTLKSPLRYLCIKSVYVQYNYHKCKLTSAPLLFFKLHVAACAHVPLRPYAKTAAVDMVPIVVVVSVVPHFVY